MGWVLYHVKRFWMIRVSGLHFSPHLRSPWLTGELTRPANVRLENESQSGPQVDRHVVFVCSPSVKIHLLQQKANITLNVRFHMYEKIYKWDVTYTLDPSPVTNCHTFSDTFPLERDVLYGRPPP